MKEKWKWIKGYRGLYKISNKGRVKSYHKEEDGYILSPTSTRGYLYVPLYKKKKRKGKKIHRLVAKAFIPNPKNKPEINHKDFNKQNNCVDNLEWVTHIENVHHYLRSNPQAIERVIKHNENIKSKTVLQINPETNKVIKEFSSTQKAANKTTADQSSISRVANGIRNTAGGYKWVFKEEYLKEE